MFKKPVNYFYTPAPAPTYKAVQTTYEWQTVAPPENVPSNLKQHLKEVKKYVAVEHNYQQDINAQIFYTPEQIEKFGIKLDTTNLQYQKADLKTFNATDLRQAAKEMTQDAINTMAINETNKQIQQLQTQINKLKSQQQTKPATSEATTKGTTNK